MAENLPTDFAKKTKSTEANPNGFIALDVAAGGDDFTGGNRTPVKTSLSRKGSQRGGERKPAVSVSGAAVAAGAEKSALLVHVAGDDEEGTLRLVTHQTAGVGGGSGRSRRLVFRRPAPWLDPRRVLVLFATLSTVGTLILLYFTLFTGSSDDSAK